ncbi:conjugative relaxase domain-containing protein, TrwC/TraI family, partial [Sinosporangium album]
MLSIAAGYDPGYLTKGVGRGAENYYLAAVAEHGEPPGVWWGEGARVLGLEPGATVDPLIMERLYSTFLDPRDPQFLDGLVPDAEKAHLGRRASGFKSAAEVFAARAAAEPEATPERLEELRIEALRDQRQAVYFFDLTFSPTKSVSLLHAGLQASALRAREAGNAEQADAYDRAAAAVWGAVMEGATAALTYARDHAGDARTGYHGRVVEGRSTGRWMGAGQWVVAQFRQHTNREGEPQLHVHQAVLNRQLCEDGRWRSLDSRAIHRVRAAAAAVGERVMEERLTRTLGVEWRARPDGHGREVVGVTAEQIAAFSSRRVQVTADLEQRIADYEAAHGRKPSARTIFKLAQDATKATKAAKPKLADMPSRAAELREWERRTTEQEIEQLTQIPASALGRVAPAAQAEARERLAAMDMQHVIEAAVAEAQAAKSAFTRYEVIRYLSRHLPDHLGALPAERVEALLEELADRALNPEGTAAGVRLVTAPELVQEPPELRRADGRSVYEAPCAQRYTTARQLDTETAVIVGALAGGAPRVDAREAAALLGIELASEVASSAPESLEGTSAAETDGEAAGAHTAGVGAGGAADRTAGEVDPAAVLPTRLAAAVESLRPDQRQAVYGILTSGRRTDVLVGPAGAGKSFTVAALAEVWREQTGGAVVGLATAQTAANVLRDEGLDATYNIKQWLDKIECAQVRVEPGQLIVVDEASMVTTDYLTAIQKVAEHAGAKVLWTGDPEQLGAPGVGGMMRQMVATAGAYQLVDIQRMRETWERDASLRLRAGDVQVLSEYDRRGRLLGGTREDMAVAACRATVADYLVGRRTLLMTSTNEQAAELAARVRADLVAYGLVSEHGVTLRDGNVAGRGDLITARKNDHTLIVGADARPLSNRDVLRVESVGAGTLEARLIGADGHAGAVVRLEGDYVAEHVQLAYAGTVHAGQGRNVDTCHNLVDEGVTREMLYVMLSRGRDGNYAYTVVGERDRQADLRPGPVQAADAEQAVQPEDRLAVLARALERVEDDQTALEAVRAERERTEHLANLGARWLDGHRQYAAAGYIAQAEARGSLPAELAEQLRSDAATGTLGRLLQQLHLSGLDAHRILDMAVAERELDTADSPAATLHWRITQAAETRGIDIDRLEPGEQYIRGTWLQRTLRTGLPRVDAWLERLAAAKDARTVVLGERSAERPAGWLVEQLGEAPAEGAARAEWIERAGRVMAYREEYGYASPTDAIGAAPSRTNPEARVAWYAAYDALGRAESDRDIAAVTLGELWVMRARYEREARWAPPHVSDDLRITSLRAREHAAEAVRLRAVAATAIDEQEREAMEARAAGEAALAAELEERRSRLAEIDDARQAWHAATEDARVMAMRADSELRRRPEVDAAALPPLHREATADTPPMRDVEEVAGGHENQLTLFDVADSGREREEAAETASVEAEAPMQGQTALSLYGEAAEIETGSVLGRAILRARSALAVIVGRGVERVAERERLRRSELERVAA